MEEAHSDESDGYETVSVLYRLLVLIFRFHSHGEQNDGCQRSREKKRVKKNRIY